MGGRSYQSSAGWYSIEYPEGWRVEETEGVVTFSNAETGYSALQISAYRTPGHQDTSKVLLEYLSDKSLPNHGSSIITDQEGLKHFSTFEFVENDWYRQFWVISQDIYLLFVTYNCKNADKAKELTEVLNIISSIRIDPT